MSLKRLILGLETMIHIIDSISTLNKQRCIGADRFLLEINSKNLFVRDCDNHVYNPNVFEDPIDWYKVDIPAFTTWGLSIDKEETYRYVDLDVFEVGLGGVLTSVQATEEGESMTNIRHFGVIQL